MSVATASMPKFGVESNVSWEPDVSVSEQSCGSDTDTDTYFSSTNFDECLREVKRNNPRLAREEAVDRAECLQIFNQSREEGTRNFLSMGLTTDEQVMDFINEEIRAYWKEKADN